MRMRWRGLELPARVVRDDAGIGRALEVTNQKFQVGKAPRHAIDIACKLAHPFLPAVIRPNGKRNIQRYRSQPDQD